MGTSAVLETNDNSVTLSLLDGLGGLVDLRAALGVYGDGGRAQVPSPTASGLRGTRREQCGWENSPGMNQVPRSIGNDGTAQTVIKVSIY